MSHDYFTTTSHIKGKHLTYEDRFTIQLRLKDGNSIRSIAREIGCSPSTVSNEIKRGTVSMYRGSVHRYKAKVGQEVYENHKAFSGRRFDFISKSKFVKYVVQHFFEDSWSLDACVGRALLSGEFARSEIVCVKTLYNYVDLGLIGIKNHNLPEKLRRNTKRKTNRTNKRKLGRSIEERPAEIDTREEFGHWECDLVIGSKTKDDNVLLTMLERKSREFFIIPLANKDATTVYDAFLNIKKQYSEHFDEVFKTITTDNGSEFANLSQIESNTKTLVYYAHPYTSCEKGSVERHNGLIRRFIPKGKRIDQFSSHVIADVENWCNTLPRKILNYRTPDEIFEEELDKIYQLDIS